MDAVTAYAKKVLAGKIIAGKPSKKPVKGIWRIWQNQNGGRILITLTRKKRSIVFCLRKNIAVIQKENGQGSR